MTQCRDSHFPLFTQHFQKQGSDKFSMNVGQRTSDQNSYFSLFYGFKNFARLV